MGDEPLGDALVRMPLGYSGMARSPRVGQSLALPKFPQVLVGRGQVTPQSEYGLWYGYRVPDSSAIPGSLRRERNDKERQVRILGEQTGGRRKEYRD